MAYVKTEIETHDVAEPKIDGYPMVIDDWTLAFMLGFTGKALWYFLTHRDELYDTFKQPKKSGGYRQIHAPKASMKNFLKVLRYHVLLPLSDKLGEHVTAYRKTKSIVNAAQRHLEACTLCDAHDQPHTCEYAVDGIHVRRTTDCVPCQPIAPHQCTRRGVKIHMDLTEFFDSTEKKWISTYFVDVVGLPAYAAHLIARAMTISFKRKGRRWEGVPQGSPCSGDICNLIADWRIDQPILKFLEGSGWTYSRYADDMYFSHPDNKKSLEAKSFIKDIYGIVQQSGYRINFKKTRTQGPMQQQKMLGIVVNQKISYPDKEYRKLRAIIYNIAKTDWQTQAKNPARYQTWLKGKIQYIKRVSPNRGRRLEKMLELCPPLTKDLP